MIRHIAALHISSPRESRHDMMFSVGTGLIIKPLCIKNSYIVLGATMTYNIITLHPGTFAVLSVPHTILLALPAIRNTT